MECHHWISVCAKAGADRTEAKAMAERRNFIETPEENTECKAEI
jgi:hypothetical protein